MAPNEMLEMERRKVLAWFFYTRMKEKRKTIANLKCHNICEVQNNAFLPHWELEHVHDEPVMPVDDHNANDAVDIRDCLAQYFISHPY
jgi:hypothetical protein